MTDSGTATADFALTAVTTVTTVSVTLPSGTDGYATEGGKNGDKHLPITVALEDNLSNPAAAASVSMRVDRNDSFYGSGVGTTGTNRTVTFTAKNAPPGTYTTTVTNVTAGLTWDDVTPPNSFDK